MNIQIKQGVKPIVKVKKLGICQGYHNNGDCGGNLTFKGFFSFNLRTYFNKPSFSCSKCGYRFSSDWSEAHGLKMPRLIKLVDSVY